MKFSFVVASNLLKCCGDCVPQMNEKPVTGWNSGATVWEKWNNRSPCPPVYNFESSKVLGGFCRVNERIASKW